MEKRSTSGKSACRLSIAAALLLILGGVGVCIYFLALLPAQWGLGIWKFVLYEVIALLPVAIGGVWIGGLYRRRRKQGWRSGTVGTVVFGLILVAAGMLLFIFSSGIVMPQWRRILISWQMLLVVIGIIQLCKADTVSGIIFLAVGTFFLIPRIDAVFPGALAVPDGFASAYWPILLVVFGASIIVGIAVGRSSKGSGKHHSACACGDKQGDGRNSAKPATTGSPRAEGTIYCNYVFSGSEQVFLEPVFRGGSIRAVFGGMELDLRHTSLPEGTTYLRVDALFGGVGVKAPADWNIILESHSIFGGVQDERHTYISPEQKDRQLVIIANCAFGGCTVE